MPKINPRIKSIDDLLGLDAAEERPIEPTPSVSLPTKNTIITLPPQAIRAFRGHPFRLYEGDRLNDLVESISEHGVLNPAIIRKIERDEDGFEYAGIGLNHEYGLTDSYKLNYFPASANQTPITWLLQVDFKETLDFIISFTNKAVEKYRNSKYGLKDVKKITLHIDETEVQQYISNAIWGMHRGIVAPAVPYLLQSVHMALEKTLLKIAQSFFKLVSTSVF